MSDRDPIGRANSGFWTAYAPEYLREHGSMLGHDDLLWCPEGLREDDAHLLGDVRGRDVLEIGCGAAQGSRWVARHGGNVTASDISPGMLQQAAVMNIESGLEFPLIEADARELPFADASFDVAFTAYGAIPFVPNPEHIFSEIARVLRPGGFWVFSTSHPMRWGFADDPDPAHLRVVREYFDPEPYAEYDGDRLTYAEYQHTFEELFRGLKAAGFTVTDLREPQWVDGNTHVWGAWSAERSTWVPGTVILSSVLTD